MESFDPPSSMFPHFPVTRNSRGNLTNQDWEDHRPVIVRLYSIERRSLQEVMEAMERDYGFLATYVLLSSLVFPPYYLF
jgi:hypothetical protein